MMRLKLLGLAVILAAPLVLHAQYIPSGGASGSQAQGAAAPAPAPMPAPMPAPISLRERALQRTAPMTPEEVRALKQDLAERGDAVRENLPDRPQGIPVSRVETIDLSPNSAPPVVRVGVGQGVSLSLLDKAGRPWKIVDNRVFDQAAYDVKLVSPSTYTVAQKLPRRSNLVLMLEDLPRPIVLTLVPATSEVDYLVEYTVPKFIGGQPPAADVASAGASAALTYNAADLLDYLYRTPPATAKTLSVRGLPGVLAWQSGATTMVVRTEGLVMLPAWNRRHVSTDRVAVYELPLSPVVTISQNGTLYRVNIDGYTVPSISK